MPSRGLLKSVFFFKDLLYFILCMPHACLVPDKIRGKSPVLELQMVVSIHVGAGH